MSWYFRKPYVSVAQRRAMGRKQVEAMKKAGCAIEPLGELSHRTKIATSFWGRAWCDHLESLGDYENRLPRGRTYVRNGSVLHLGIERGKITALVQGSDLYEQTILIEPLAAAKWKRIQKRCRGGIGSLIELLQGTVSDEIMAVVTDPIDGLFPRPEEISFACSCPDWAILCKHLAAILYGVGAKLDRDPELLFLLRGVDHRELIDESAVAAAIEGRGKPTRRRTLSTAALADVFGIDLDDKPGAPTPTTTPTRTRPRTRTRTPGPPVRANRTTRRTTRARKTKGSAMAAPAPAPPSFEPTAATVREMRTKLGLTQSGFAHWIGVSTPSISNWEKKRGPLNLQESSLRKLEAVRRSLEEGL